MAFIFFIAITLSWGTINPAIAASDVNAYILKEIAFLDDLKEQANKQLDLNELTEISFAAASILHLGTFFTNAVELRFELFKKGSDVFGGLNNLPRVGNAGNFLFGRLSKDSSSKVILSDEDIAVLHREEIPQLLKVINFVRQQLLNQLKNSNSGKYVDYSDVILKLRPSYKKIFDECSSDPSFYQNQILLSMYRSSLNDYFSLLKLSPEEIEKQIKARSISYSLSSYINQEVTSPALYNCFQSRDKEFSFIKKLFAVDLTAKVVFLSTLGTIGVAAKYLISFTSSLHISKLLTAPTIQKTLTFTSIVTSSKALYELKKKYISLNSDKDNSLGFTMKINEQIQSDIKKNLEDLESLAKQRNITQVQLQEIQTKITEWKQFQSSIN